MDCKTFQDECIELVLAESQPADRAALLAHADACPACAGYLAELQETVRTLRPSHSAAAGHHFKERVMNRILAMESEAKKPTAPRRWMAWKPALAAMVVIGCAALVGLVFRNGGNRAFALEPVVEATRTVRFIHMKFYAETGSDYAEMWAQFDPQGQIVHLRYDMPTVDEDGPRVVNWQAEKAEVWLKGKNTLVVVREASVLNTMRLKLDDFDPRRLVEKLCRDEAAGRAIVTREAAAPPGEVRLSAMWKTAPERREVYFIDTAARLVTRIDKYENRNGKESLEAKVHYLDYNNPEVAAAFKVALPTDVVRIDQVGQEVGLSRGNMSEDHVVVAVVRGFWDAVMAGDYDRAGRLADGVPGELLKKNMESGGRKYVRIVSIGEPRPHHLPAPGIYEVPCEIEVEKDGKKRVETFAPGVRPVYNQPDRWTIFGGI